MTGSARREPPVAGAGPETVRVIRPGHRLLTAVRGVESAFGD
jgi:hypothetical protein